MSNSIFQHKLVNDFRSWFQSISQREQVIVVAAMIFLPCFLVYTYILPPIQSALDDSNARLDKSYKDLQALPYIVNRFQNLVSRQKQMEDLYERIDISEGALSYLAELVKTKAGIPQGDFVINEEPPRPFGKKYEQVPYKISFKITSYERLIDFIAALTRKDKPLVITNLDLNKSRLGDHIQVMVQVSGVRTREDSK